MNHLDNIKSIVFDAYGTLLNINSLDLRLEHYYGDGAQALSTIWRRKQLEYTWLRSLMDRYKPFSEVTMEALAFGCAQLGLSLSNAIKDDLEKRYYSLDVYPEVPKVLKALAAKYSLAILSNASIEMLEKAALHNKIDGMLDHIFSADAIKTYKPSPLVYQIADAGLPWSKNEIAFVSSNTWDVSGAKSYGFQVFSLKRGNSHQETLGFEPDRMIESLEALT
ncbi:MAG: haloacid dehalogenase type II, partial [Cyclobacteriaceae bacterium]